MTTGEHHKEVTPEFLYFCITIYSSIIRKPWELSKMELRIIKLVEELKKFI